MKPAEFSNRIGVSEQTLRNWDNTGKLIAKRTKGNHRFYTEDDYKDYMGISSKNQKKSYIYARVSTRNQKDDLENQIEFLKQYTNSKGIIVDDCLTDIGSGMNYKRKKWNELLNMVMQDKVDNIYVSYKDRFVRFGFEWFEQLCKKHQTNLIVVNNEKTSPEQEFVDDLIAIIHVFSCRVYGLRKYKKKVGDDFKCK
jgi:predicted site-specific integrase-resolvase